MTSRQRQPPNWAAREALAINIRDARRRKGLAQEALAHESGVARSYVSTIERGLANLTLDHLVRLADILDVEPRDLVPTRKQIRTVAKILGS